MAKKKYWFVMLVVLFGIGCVDAEITERNLVGRWELENTINISSEFILVRAIDFFSDGTGIETIEIIGIPFSLPNAFTWQLREGNRLQWNSADYGTQIAKIELSERGTLLTFHIEGIQRMFLGPLSSDPNQPIKTIYRRR